MKALVKASQTHTQISRQAGIKEVLGDISNLATAEKQEDTPDSKTADNNQVPGTDDPSDLDDIIEVTVKLTERNNKPQTAQPETKMIRLNNLPDIKRDTVLRGKKMVARLLSSHVQFVDRAAPDLQAAIAATGAGRAKGECTGVTMRYVAVIFASSTFGESASRPRYRLPPLSPDSVRKLLEAARGRFDAPADADREIDEGDMFLLFDGGRPGVETCCSEELGCGPATRSH